MPGLHGYGKLLGLVAAVCGAGLGGCATRQPHEAWRSAVAQYISRRGGDPSALRELHEVRSPRAARKAPLVIGTLDVPVARGGWRDVQGVLAGVVRDEERRWYVFAVGITALAQGRGERVTDVRAMACSREGDRLVWRSGPADRHALAQYVEARRGADEGHSAFPGPLDRFGLEVEGHEITVREGSSGASWKLNLRHDDDDEERPAGG